MPLITVCITTYNRAQLLVNAVQSVLSQTFNDFELIIVDDASSDNTKQIVNNDILNKDVRIQYIRHENNKGLAAARNTAIFNAKGKFFTFIDDDDNWSPLFLDEFVKLAQTFNENWCFCCGSIIHDYLGRTVYVKYNPLEGDLLNYIKLGYTPPVASQFYFTNTLRKVGGYNEDIKTGVDHDIWLNLAFHGIKVKSIDKYLSYPSDNFDVIRQKMTNQFDKRINGIEKSLKLWKVSIVSHCGKSFYDSFSKAYMIREKKKFIKIYLLQREYYKAYLIYKDLQFGIPLKFIVTSIMGSILAKVQFFSFKKEKFVTRKANLNIHGNF